MKKNILLLLAIAFIGSCSLQAATYTITNNSTANIYGRIRPAHQYIQLFFGDRVKGPKVSLRGSETKSVTVEDDIASQCLTEIKMARKPYRKLSNIINKVCGDATIIIEGTYPNQTTVIQMP